MRCVNLLWAVLATLFIDVNAQEADQCACSGLDYTDGGSYLVDGNSDDEFTFTSVFEGCFQSTITPILVSPDGYGYECSSIESQPDGIEQASSCAISYSEMSSGPWTILIEAPAHEFTVQRDFNLTVGAEDDINTVIVTTRYQDAETVTGNCYLQTDTVVHYIPGRTTTIVSEVERWSTTGVVTQHYATTVTKTASCQWP
ncbi:hypothetical protein C8A00DRAFT_18794, partial [Chaetomidium leptoderma]